MSFGPIGYGSLYGALGFSFGLITGSLFAREEKPTDKTIQLAGHFFNKLGTGILTATCGIYGTTKGCSYGWREIKMEPLSWPESSVFYDCTFSIALAGVVTIACGNVLHMIANRLNKMSFTTAGCPIHKQRIV